jgi:hypothetical protein
MSHDARRNWRAESTVTDRVKRGNDREREGRGKDGGKKYLTQEGRGGESLYFFYKQRNLCFMDTSFWAPE